MENGEVTKWSMYLEYNKQLLNIIGRHNFQILLQLGRLLLLISKGGEATSHTFS